MAGPLQAAWIAGAAELLNWMRLGIAEPLRAVDIGRIGALRGIGADGVVVSRPPESPDTVGAAATRDS